ncbi:MAG: hypothetical protein F2663_05350 [Actinobacteria bacterium]|uniref:Unannotated protein n=1 Tax=freshwater metagenome TaxID=449393 RepID=A0A6J6PDN4_9ZZZZ|nr:hypothetical protein [Actinomycetota bacterium]
MNRTDLGLLAYNAILLAVGYAALRPLGFAARGTRITRAGLAYLVGFGVLGVALTLAAIVGISPTIPAIVIVAIVIIGATTRISLRPDATTWHATPLGFGRYGTLAAAIGGLVLTVASLAAIALAAKGQLYPGFWDAIDFWIPKAQAIYYGHGIPTDTWAGLKHPEYPPLLPTLDAGIFHFTGGFHPSLLPLQAVLLGIAFLLTLLGLLDGITPRALSLPALAALATTPWFWWRLQTPTGDQILAYFVTGAAVATIRWLITGERSYFRLGFVLLITATLTKLEGGFVGLLLAAVICVAIYRQRRSDFRSALLLLATPLAIVPWRLWLAHAGIPGSSPDYRISYLAHPGFLVDHTHRFTESLRVMLHAPFAEYASTSLVVVATAALVVSAVRRPVIAATVAAWCALAAGGLAAIYWIGTLPVSWYIENSVSRVGATVIVAAAALTPLLLGLALSDTITEDE